MLKKLGDALEAQLEKMNPVDATQFGDPFAEKVAWTPMVAGGRRLRTHNLVETSQTRMEFRATMGAWLVSLILLLCGVGIVTLVHVFDVDPPVDGELDARMVAYALGAFFTVAAAGSAYMGSTPIVFDRSFNAHWRGRLAPGARPDPDKHRNYTPLDEIYALQLIGELVYEETTSTYRSYELNLVLRDGKRIHVVDHDDYEHLRADVDKLAGMLALPVWDATTR